MPNATASFGSTNTVAPPGVGVNAFAPKGPAPSPSAANTAPPVTPPQSNTPVTSPTVLTSANKSETAIPENIQKLSDIQKSLATPGKDVFGNPVADTGKGYADYTNSDQQETDPNAPPITSDAYGNAYIPGTTQISSGDPGVDSILKQFGDLKTSMDASSAAAITNIQNEYQGLIDAQKQANAGEEARLGGSLIESGATRTASGGALAGDTFGGGFMQAQVSYGLSKISDLANKEASAITQAQQAQQSGDMQLLDKSLTVYDQIRQEKLAQSQKLQDSVNAQKVKIQDQNNAAQRDSAIMSLFKQGTTDPADIASTLNNDQTFVDTYGGVTAADIKSAVDNLNPNANAVANVMTEVAKNGAPQSVLSAIGAATTVQDAIKAAGSWIQTATGTLGDYLYYSRQAQAAGQTPESYQAYLTADEEQKSKIAIDQAVAIASAKGADTGLSKDDITNVFGTLNDYNGAKYITPTDLTGYTSAQKSTIMQAAKLSGIPTLEPKDADALKSIQTAQADLQSFDDFINTSGDGGKPVLPKTSWGQPKQYADVKLNEYLQTNNQLGAFNSWKASVIPVLTALKGAGSGGGGGASRLFTSIETMIPSDTDTMPTAEAKIKNINTLLDNGAKSIVPQTPADKLVSQTNEAQTKIQEFDNSSPKNQTLIDQLHTAFPKATVLDIYTKLQQKGLIQ